jgi:hypothetical protein
MIIFVFFDRNLDNIEVQEGTDDGAIIIHVSWRLLCQHYS